MSDVLEAVDWSRVDLTDAECTGDRTCYNHRNCRSDACIDANNAYMRDYRARRRASG